MPSTTNLQSSSINTFCFSNIVASMLPFTACAYSSLHHRWVARCCCRLLSMCLLFCACNHVWSISQAKHMDARGLFSICNHIQLHTFKSHAARNNIWRPKYTFPNYCYQNFMLPLMYARLTCIICTTKYLQIVKSAKHY
jgi:hypothetical protein